MAQAASAVATGLFALPKSYDSSDPFNGPGARRQARHKRKAELTEELGSAAANTQLAAEATTEADRITKEISPKVEQLATEDKLLQTTITGLEKNQHQHHPSSGTNTTTTTPPLASQASPATANTASRGHQSEALGEARAAEYYNDAAHSLRTSATRWGPGLVLLMGLAALLWNWYNQLPKLYLFGTIVVLFVASLYPTYVMQLPRAAISPLMKLV